MEILEVNPRKVSAEREDNLLARARRYEAQRAKLRDVVSRSAPKDLDAIFNTTVIDVAADVQSFADLIDDYRMTFDRLSVAIFGGRVVITCHQLGEAAREDVYPADAFYRSLSRFANDNTPLGGLNQALFVSLFGAPEGVGKSVGTDLLALTLSQLSRHYIYKSGKRANQRKPFLLRTLRPDRKGRWPKFRTCRAVLHAGYRADLGHLWLVRSLLEVAPSAKVGGYFFDGDLLTGKLYVSDFDLHDSRGEFIGGVQFVSGEVGNRRLYVQPFLMHKDKGGWTACIVGKYWSRTHSVSEDNSKARSDLIRHVRAQLPTIHTYMTAMLSLADVGFEARAATLDRVVAAAALRLRLTQKEARIWRMLLDDEPREGVAVSGFAVQNSFARLANLAEDRTRELELNVMAGDMISWDFSELAARAAALSTAELDRMFPVSEDE